MIHILTTFFIASYKSDKNQERTLELLNAIKDNIANELVDKIHLFVENEESIKAVNDYTNNSDKIIFMNIGRQPLYWDFFLYILNFLKDNICMICNGDIVLGECNIDILNKLYTNKYAYSLTRHEYDMTCDLIEHYGGSHDAYIFHSKYLEQSIINEHTYLIQNLSGIETHVISAFVKSGFEVHNPCKQIKIIHYHKTQLRAPIRWVGLHPYGDFEYHRKSCWWVHPETM